MRCTSINNYTHVPSILCISFPVVMSNTTTTPWCDPQASCFPSGLCKRSNSEQNNEDEEDKSNEEEESLAILEPLLWLKTHKNALFIYIYIYHMHTSKYVHHDILLIHIHSSICLWLYFVPGFSLRKKDSWQRIRKWVGGRPDHRFRSWRCLPVESREMERESKSDSDEEGLVMKRRQR